MADSSYQTRPSLLLRVRDAQDGTSWRTFVDVYGPLVFGHCRRRGLRHEDAEDVTQKVFAQLSQSIRSFEYKPEIGRFRDWLGRVVRNEINRLLRQRERREQGHGGEEPGLLEQVESRGEDTAWNEDFQAHVFQAALARARPRFEPDTWQAFELVWLHNRPPADVSRQLGRAIDWVYVAKSRVLKQLWDEVQDLADDAALLPQWTR